MIKKSLVILGLSAALLGGCASFYDAKVDKPAVYHQPVQIDEDYNISGRFAIKTLQKDYYGNFNWQRSNGNDVLNFMSPVGTTVAQIKVESGIAELIDKDNNIYTGRNLDQLMIDKLGFNLPLNYLHYWVQGVPLPDQPIQSRLASGFTQLDWKVEYLSWTDNNHPRVVQVSKNDLRIKLLTNWQ